MKKFTNIKMFDFIYILPILGIIIFLNFEYKEHLNALNNFKNKMHISQIVSLSVCPFVGSKISDQCSYFENNEISKFKMELSASEISNPPSKVKIVKSVVLKILSVTKEKEKQLVCVKLISFLGFEDEYYLSLLKTDKDCKVINNQLGGKLKIKKWYKKN